MKPIIDGVWQLDGFPSHAVNAFFVDGILFDCRTRWAAAHIARELRDSRVSTIALTHAHPDHWGAAPALSARFGAPIAVHRADAGVVTGEAVAGSHIAFRLGRRFLEAGVCADIRPLEEGDRVGDFTVVHAPGHSSGHVVYFRESDRLAVAGDLFNTMHTWTRRRRLAEPPAHLSVDAQQNRLSILKLAELRPSLVLPGHGPALTDMRVLARFSDEIREASARRRVPSGAA